MSGRYRKSGKHVASTTPYGYLKSETDHNQWIVDEEAAEVVRRIFRLNILGKLPDERYIVLDRQYAKEQRELSNECDVIEKKLAEYDENRKSAGRFIALVDKYDGFEELTTTMLNEFVKKIVVHERDTKGCTQSTQQVDIYFNFIGQFVPPHFGEHELTEEEIEEQRRVAERRKKLHEAYLKRKESGSQKVYEERIKARKKAEINARKNAIRREDIENGVFIPFSMIQAEPREGVCVQSMRSTTA